MRGVALQRGFAPKAQGWTRSGLPWVRKIKGRSTPTGEGDTLAATISSSQWHGRETGHSNRPQQPCPFLIDLTQASREQVDPANQYFARRKSSRVAGG